MARELGLALATVRRVDTTGGRSRLWVEVPSVAPGQQLLAVAVARPRQRLVSSPSGQELVDEPWTPGQRVLVGFLAGDPGSPVVLAPL